MDKKENARILVFVYGGYVMRYLYLIIVIPFYGRVLGVTEYGRVLAAMSLMNVIWMLASYGFTFVGMRDVAKSPERSHHNDVFSLHSSARVFTGVVGLAVGVIATLSSPTLSERPLMGLLATLLGLVSALNLGWLFQGRQRFRTPIIIEVIGFAISLVLILSIVRGPQDSVWVVASLLIAGVISSVISYGLTFAHVGLPRFRISGVMALMRGSTMLFAYSTGSAVLTASSTYLLTLLSTPDQVGYFGAAERFATIGLSLMGPAAQVFIPTISRQLAQGDTDGARASSRRGATLLMGYGVLALLAALSLSPFLMPLILGKAFTPSAHVLQCLAVMFPFAAFNEFVAFYVFVPRQKDRLLAIAGITSGLANLAAALFLAPLYGAMGMAIARVIGEATLTIMLIGLMIRSDMIGLIPGVGRAAAMARGVFQHAASAKDK